jgi:hypothetical protein
MNAQQALQYADSHLINGEELPEMGDSGQSEPIFRSLRSNNLNLLNHTLRAAAASIPPHPLHSVYQTDAR